MPKSSAESRFYYHNFCMVRNINAIDGEEVLSTEALERTLAEFPHISEFRRRLIQACFPQIHPGLLATCGDFEKGGVNHGGDTIAYFMARRLLRTDHNIDDPTDFLAKKGVLAPPPEPSPEDVGNKD